MKTALSLGLALFFCFASTLTCFAQQPPPPASSPATLNTELDKELSIIEQQVVGIADAMPEDKYSFVPTNGEFKTVRNFGEQVKHIAWANNFYYNLILGQHFTGRPAMPTFTSKAEIMQYLRDSFALGHKAVASITPENAFEPLQTPVPFKTRVAMAAWAPAHAYDIYGQMVEYLRMNGIVPPASRSRTE